METNKFPTFSYKKNMKFIVLILYFILLWLILPISLGVFFAYLLYPIINFVHKRLKLPYIISAIVISILIFLLEYIPSLYISIQSIISIYPETKIQVNNLQLFESEYLILLENIYNKSLILYRFSCYERS